MSAGKPQLSSDSLDALLAAAVDAMIISDADGHVLRFNPAAERLFGYSENEMLGRNLGVLMPSNHRDHHDGYMSRYLETGKAEIIGKGREVIGLHVSGEQIPLHLSVGEIGGDGPERFVGIIRDLSRTKRIEAEVRTLESQLTHADRLVVLGELTAGMAHEINQPLTAIAAFSDAGRRLIGVQGEEARAELKNICRRISEQAHRAGDVVARLRRLSQKGDLVKRQHDLKRLVENVLPLFDHEARKSGTLITTHYEQQVESLSVDEIQLQQVLVNLVKNSLDALKDAGTENGEIRVRVLEDEEFVNILVEDNGPGVAEDIEPRLFEPFFTTKKRGVGLGLSICRNIANGHGGSLRYQRSGLGGARFTLSLPLSYIG